MRNLRKAAFGSGPKDIAARDLKAKRSRMGVFYRLVTTVCSIGDLGDNHFNIGRSSTSAMDHFDQALKFIQAGRLDEARILPGGVAKAES